MEIEHQQLEGLVALTTRPQGSNGLLMRRETSGFPGFTMHGSDLAGHKHF